MAGLPILHSPFALLLRQPPNRPASPFALLSFALRPSWCIFRARVVRPVRPLLRLSPLLCDAVGVAADRAGAGAGAGPDDRESVREADVEADEAAAAGIRGGAGVRDEPAEGRAGGEDGSGLHHRHDRRDAVSRLAGGA